MYSEKLSRDKRAQISGSLDEKIRDSELLADMHETLEVLVKSKTRMQSSQNHRTGKRQQITWQQDQPTC